MAQQDVVIIGAGHNALVTAAYLARAGRRVVVLERRDAVGGAAVTEELFPGYRVSTCAGGAGYLSAEVRGDLGLDARGLAILPSETVAFAPQPDGSHLTIWRDTARTADEIRRFSARDADRYPAFVSLMQKLSGVVAGMCRITPPDLPELSRADLRSIPELAGPMRRLGRKHLNDLLRILPMPASDLVDEWFESDVVKGVITANGVRDVTWGPKEAGTAYTLLYHWGLSDTGLFRSAGVVKGGMGALTTALADAAKSHGAEIRTGAAVASIDVEKGRAAGVTLVDGERVEASVVVSGADPRTTFVSLLDPRAASATLMRHVRNVKYRGSAARVHLALSGLPSFRGVSEPDAATLLSGPIQLAPDMTYIQRAYDCTKYGEYSPRPYLDVEIPTLLDPDLAPAGHHVLSITVKYAPYRLREGDWKTRGDAFTETVIDTLAEYAPDVRERIVDRRTFTPADLEETFGLPEANGNHGEMTLDQFLHMRPLPGYAQYRAPVAGVYMCSAGTHPGGGVTGIPGRNAAREVLKD
jgi:phytoene dehydrogenase-like protein